MGTEQERHQRIPSNMEKNSSGLNTAQGTVNNCANPEIGGMAFSREEHTNWLANTSQPKSTHTGNIIQT